MSFFERLLCFLETEMPEPKAFGWFHSLWLGIVIIAIFVLYKLKKYHNEKQLKIILGIYGIIALILETLKQLIWTFNYDTITKTIIWDYEWYAFPFQLCTTPIYISLICLFLNKTKIRDYLLSYMAYVTILGSISTMLLPDSCLVSDILVNIHTMWLHLGSFVVSTYLLMSGEVKIDTRYLKKGITIFLLAVIVAYGMNIIVYKAGILNGETFNMFYISPYFISDLPVFDIIQENVPYFIYLFIYVVALGIGAYIIYCIASLIKYICEKDKTK